MSEKHNRHLKTIADSNLLNHEDLEFEELLREFNPRALMSGDSDFVPHELIEPRRATVSRAQMMVAIAASLVIGFFAGGSVVYFNISGVPSGDLVLSDSSNTVAGVQDETNRALLTEPNLQRSTIVLPERNTSSSDLTDSGKMNSGEKNGSNSSQTLLAQQPLSDRQSQLSRLFPFANLAAAYPTGPASSRRSTDDRFRRFSEHDSIEDIAPRLLKRFRSGERFELDSSLSATDVEEFL